MKKILLTIIKILVIVLLITWMILFLVDYFRAKDGTKPLVCLNESTVEVDEGTYYSCTSFGYKYFEYRLNAGGSKIGFGPSFIKNETEKELGL